MTLKLPTILSSIEEIIKEARNGRMFILVDDEDRENEGDLVIPAQFATPQAVNFMAQHGRGLICLSLIGERCHELRLPLMAKRDQSRLQTAFTVSIEAKNGVTTGISAADRAHTIAVAINPTTGADDISTPGHVFPLMASDGGVLVRAGHTEAAVDISRLAGCNPSGVICEIMNQDGTMARMSDLAPFAHRHGLKVASIADLIAYRLRTDTIVKKNTEMPFQSLYGGAWRLLVYESVIDSMQHIALVKGEITPDTPTLVRVHAMSILDDVLGAVHGGGGQLREAMGMIADAGAGVVVALRENGRATPLPEMHDAPVVGSATRLVEYGVGTQILLDIGVKDMILLSNTDRHVVGLDGYGQKIVGRRSINGGAKE